MHFSKPPATIDQQIKLLESRGMLVADHANARHYLANINYFRLSAYWLHSHPLVKPGAMGFPPDWRDRPIWK